MGTSGAFKGSGGKAAEDLRDALADWLGDAPSDDSSPENDASGDQQGEPQTSAPLTTSALSSVFSMWGSGGGAGHGSNGGAGGNPGGNGNSGASGRSSGGVHRNVASVATPAGRAGALAKAYTSGDRETLEAAGLNYNELRALGNPLEVGKRILDATFDTQPDSSIEDSESWMIVADLTSWILESPEDQLPAPDDIVRRSLELMITRTALTEVGDTIRQEKNPAKRREAENEVGRIAKVYASQATLSGTGATSAEISTAITDSVEQLKAIYGVAQ